MNTQNCTHRFVVLIIREYGAIGCQSPPSLVNKPCLVDVLLQVLLETAFPKSTRLVLPSPLMSAEAWN